MDIEQIKLIVDLIKDLGVQGKEGLIWWLMIKEVLPVIAWSSFGFTLITLLYRLSKSFTRDSDLIEIRSVLFPRLSGYLTDKEVADIKQKINRLKGLEK